MRGLLPARVAARRGRPRPDQGPHTAAVAGRLAQLADELAGEGRDTASAAATVAAAVSSGDSRVIWLVLAVLTAELPLVEDVVAVRRRIRVQGADETVRALVTQACDHRANEVAPTVRVLRDAVLVDLEHTAQTRLATGIQRVARQTAARWDRDHDVQLVGWTSDGRALRSLTVAERARALTGEDTGSAGGDGEGPESIVVPRGGAYLLPELVTESDRLGRLAALGRYGGVRTGVIGFDCVPVTSAETTAEAMGGAFAQNLAAVREFDRVGTISHAAAAEYAGWRRMCHAAGWDSPDVQAVPLPTEPAPAAPGAQERFVSRTTAVASVPFVLVVGSHEPRKNHLALLHAAERLWREGLTFGLLFVGGNSWRSERFQAELARARVRERRVDSVRALPDDELWAAYRSARCVAFPSLNEGFGLPVAEALSVGTPVLTSDFGSMAEIAVGGGALLVDPRDDDALVEGLRALLADEALVDELRRLAAARPTRTWDTYAEELWRYLLPTGTTAD